ncbi:hypothetical protein H558_02740 [Bordetella holmesii H558]|nr:hypothetical protein H558_02740 [Bordetella holmesii H558]AOB36614.1 hypothetical protein BBB42_14545 [Bordetella holmesii]
MSQGGDAAAPSLLQPVIPCLAGVAGVLVEPQLFELIAHQISGEQGLVGLEQLVQLYRLARIEVFAIAQQ